MKKNILIIKRKEGEGEGRGQNDRSSGRRSASGLVPDPERVRSRRSHHVGVLVLQLVQLFALLPQKQDSVYE